MWRDQEGSEAFGPEGLDDGWWTSVLQEEQSRTAPRSRLSERENGHRPALPAVNPAVDWECARALYESDETIELEVVGYNRGGLLVVWNSLRGFVPASHLLNFPNEADEVRRKSILATRVGERLLLKVIEFDPTQGRIVFSERAARSGPGSRRQLLQRIQPGDVLTGLVTNICDFGVFVDLGGVEGLIHVSEISWSRVAHPRDVLRIDETVEVKVLSVDRDNARVALSLKRLRPDPWSTVAKRYSVDQIIEGRITTVVNFGAFISLEDGLEGLIHVSELAEGTFLHPRNVVQEGDWVRARILSIDSANRRLSLSLRRSQVEQVTV
ncbi:MAG: S1 RNA-binding domain-containing protein [Anaerolineales bacterium]|nr:S1 RNA-binding domain-containing protein [Anaerolineales bacterium]